MRPKYSIVVPSRNRPENMKKLLTLFPNAIIAVDASGVEQYKTVVPPKQLIVHPDMLLIETRNWIFDKVQTDCIIQFNDDVDKLMSLGLHTKTHRDPNVIKAVIENTMQCSHDLDIGVFCWSLTCNGGLLHPEVRPFRAAAPCSAHAFGILGKARNRRLDTTFRGCGDFDFTLETLRTDRLLLCDVRWHFSCGGMSRGKGGETGSFTRTQAASAQIALRKKWGKCVGRSAAQQISKKNTYREFSVNVQRTSPLGMS
jgi:hypothetical protein